MCATPTPTCLLSYLLLCLLLLLLLLLLPLLLLLLLLIGLSPVRRVVLPNGEVLERPKRGPLKPYIDRVYLQCVPVLCL